MSWAVRKYIVAAGAASLLSTQAAYAAPLTASNSGSLDPLVALSAFGTAQSQAAVCAAGASAAAAGAAVTAAQAGPAPGCLLPMSAPPAAAGLPPAGPAVATAPGTSLGVWPVLLGLVGIALAAALLLGDDDGDGVLQPVSPS